MTYINSVAGNGDWNGLRWGVESICVQLTELGAKIALGTYYKHRSRGLTVREVKDAVLSRWSPGSAPTTSASSGRGRSGRP